jgi:cytochrome c oxidase subunit II
MQIPFLPTEASTGAVAVDQVFLVLLALGGFFTLLIAAMIVIFAVRFRSGARVRRVPIKGTTRLEMGGIGFLAILSLGMFFWAGATYVNMFKAPPNAMTIFVTGKQWMWKAQQPTGQREINTLHIPTGRPIRLLLTSEDVIHDFFVPAFRLKTDVVPGRYSSMWFEATQPGTYHLFCSQYCGTGHSLMVGDIIVQTPAEYQAWLAGGPQQSPADQGARLFQDLGCNACHRSDSLARAPNLVGLFGQPVRLSNGQTVTADENYIRESILNPTAKVVQGYQPIMPSFQGRVTEEQLFALLAYIQSLGNQPGAGGTPQPALNPPNVPPAGPPTSLPVEGGTPVGPNALGTPSGSPSLATPQATTNPAQPLGPTPAGAQGPGPAAATAGEALFNSQGCSGCHLANGSGPAPALTGVYGQSVQLDNGQTVTADEAYIHESIVNPTAKIVKGYQPIMPSFQGKLSDTQINQLIAYIKSLGTSR